MIEMQVKSHVSREARAPKTIQGMLPADVTMTVEHTMGQLRAREESLTGTPLS